jgi:hypothetical protein
MALIGPGENTSHALVDHVCYKRFAQEFFVDCDAQAAYLRAGYKAKRGDSARHAVARLLTNVTVQQCLANEFARLQARLNLQQDRATLETCRLAYSNITQMCSWDGGGVVVVPSAQIPEDAQAAIQEVSRVEKIRQWAGADGAPVTETDVRTRVKLHPKVPALAQLHEMFRRGTPAKDVEHLFRRC